MNEKIKKALLPGFVSEVEENLKNPYPPLETTSDGGVIVQDSIDYSRSKDMIVSYSEIFKWQTCPRQYYYRFILGLSPIEESDAITTGIKGHRLLQTFYELMREGKSKEEALELTHASAKKLMSDGKFTDYNLAKAWTLVDNYVRATDFTAEAILVENRFLLPASLLDNDPLLSDVQIGFTPDVVFQRKGNKLDIEDAKFVQREWSKSKKNRFQQIKLYQLFMDRMGYNVSRCILRFFNVTTGNISVQNYTMSKVEELNLIHDFMSGVKDVVRFKKGSPHTFKFAPRTMNYTACQFCAFEFVCTLEAEGKDATKTLESQFMKSNYDYTR